MEKRNEVWHVIIAIILMTIIISYNSIKDILTLDGSKIILQMLLYSAIIILVPISAKRISASIRDIEINHKIWRFKRYWFYKKSYFKKPVPIGVILPLLFSIASQGFIKVMTFLQFDAKASVTKVTKKTGSSEINESDLGMIAFWGLIATLALSLLANYLDITLLARYAIYYAIWNLLPLGNIDGMKILMSAGEPRHGSASGHSKMIAPLYFISWIIVLIILLIVLF